VPDNPAIFELSGNIRNPANYYPAKILNVGHFVGAIRRPSTSVCTQNNTHIHPSADRRTWNDRRVNAAIARQIKACGGV